MNYSVDTSEWVMDDVITWNEASGSTSGMGTMCELMTKVLKDKNGKAPTVEELRKMKPAEWGKLANAVGDSLSAIFRGS